MAAGKALYAKEDRRRHWAEEGVDIPFLILVLLLLTVGLLTLYSASSAQSMYDTGYSISTKYLQKQAICAAVGLVCMYFFSRLPAQFWFKFSWVTYGVSIALLLLVLCALANGVADLSQKMFVREMPQTEIAVFNFYTYVFASVILLVFCILFRAREGKTQQLRSPAKVLRPILGYVIVMAACLFLNVYFKTSAARYLNAAAIYPLSQGGAVILSVLMSTFLFDEKINLKGIIGVVLSFVALLFINVL